MRDQWCGDGKSNTRYELASTSCSKSVADFKLRIQQRRIVADTLTRRLRVRRVDLDPDVAAIVAQRDQADGGNQPRPFLPPHGAQAGWLPQHSGGFGTMYPGHRLLPGARKVAHDVSWRPIPRPPQRVWLYRVFRDPGEELPYDPRLEGATGR